ncbi:NUDIX domain-containing protein [Candidatus Uhrbacteria bacterium]|nr:NUDIX domain-containing protein [Candidatus Uhrbacteria bacterium]
MRVEVSAGGVVYRRVNGQIEIGFILDPYGKWAFPKGHVEEGEVTEEAAAREAEEEMGIKGIKVREYLGKADFWFRDRFVRKGELVHKFLHYYLMEAPMGVVAKPQKKEKIQEVIWIPLNKAYAKSDYKDIEPLLVKAIILLGGSIPALKNRVKAKQHIRRKRLN